MNKWEKIHRAKGKSFLLKAEQSLFYGDYSKYERLRMEIWGEPADPFSGVRNCLCENYFDKGGSLFLSAFVWDEEGTQEERWDNFAGFSYGYVGARDKKVGYRQADNLCFYSQYTGIKPSFQGFGLGVVMKEFQKKIVLELLGVGFISCTFDPLTAINAARNIHHFGMDVLAYKDALYGDFSGHLNREDVPCDRFYVMWDLKKDKTPVPWDFSFLEDEDLYLVAGEPVLFQGKSGMCEMQKVKSQPFDRDSDRVLIEIPSDFYRMIRETEVSDPEVRRIPLDWRLATRKAFKACMEADFRIADFLTAGEGGRRRNAYLLLRD